MNGWIKIFADGTQEIGSDEDVHYKRASWTRGRLSYMTSVELHHNGETVVIQGLGDYWQSDDYEVDVGNNTPSLTKRRVQKKLTDGDIHMCINKGYKHHIYNFSLLRPEPEADVYCRKIQSKYVDKWFTVELDIKTSSVIFDFKESQI